MKEQLIDYGALSGITSIKGPGLVIKMQDGDRDRILDTEIEVLRKIVDGKTNTEIAHDMCISTHTAKAHVGNILSKLSVSDRVEAAVKAVRAKIVD